MARSKVDELANQAVDENGQMVEPEVLDFGAFLELAGDLKRVVNRKKRGALADYIGQRVYILGVESTKRGKELVRLSVNSDRSDPSRVTAPPAVIAGLQRAFSGKPNAVFSVQVVKQGAKSVTLA